MERKLGMTTEHEGEKDTTGYKHSGGAGEKAQNNKRYEEEKEERVLNCSRRPWWVIHGVQEINWRGKVHNVWVNIRRRWWWRRIQFPSIRI